MTGPYTQLTIHFAEKSGLLVLTFIGRLVRETRDELDKCLEQLQEIKPLHAIILMQGVTEIDRSVLSRFALIQKAIRDKPAELRVCSLSSRLRLYLEREGVIRTSELAKDLTTALLGFGINAN